MNVNNEDYNNLLSKLDEIARDVSRYEYGLPIYDEEQKALMREAIREWLSNRGFTQLQHKERNNELHHSQQD